MGDELGADAWDWVSERTDYPRQVVQLALAHEADGGVVNVDFDGRPKNNVSNYASAQGTAMSDKSFERPRQGRRRVQRAAIGNVTPMSPIGTKQACRSSPCMSASSQTATNKSIARGERSIVAPS
jgi:hypothetical protein